MQRLFQTHLPTSFLFNFYGQIVGRVLAYGAFAYIVSLVFTYVFYQLTVPGNLSTFQEACAGTPVTATLFVLTIGFFAVRDAIETNKMKLVEVLKA